jgi:hypothetical protein
MQLWVEVFSGFRSTLLKNMVGRTRLELLTSTVSIYPDWAFQRLNRPQGLPKFAEVG